MTGHRNFDELRKPMAPARAAANRKAAVQLLEGLALHELRLARRKSQDDLARELHVGQPAVAKLERRTDMYVSNLRRYVEALGGTLEITANFPDTSVKITNFSDIAESN